MLDVVVITAGIMCAEYLVGAWPSVQLATATQPDIIIG